MFSAPRERDGKPGFVQLRFFCQEDGAITTGFVNSFCEQADS